MIKEVGNCFKSSQDKDEKNQETTDLFSLDDCYALRVDLQPRPDHDLDLEGRLDLRWPQVDPHPLVPTGPRRLIREGKDRDGDEGVHQRICGLEDNEIVRSFRIVTGTRPVLYYEGIS